MALAIVKMENVPLLQKLEIHVKIALKKEVHIVHRIIKYSYFEMILLLVWPKETKNQDSGFFFSWLPALQRKLRILMHIKKAVGIHHGGRQTALNLCLKS